MKDWFIKIGMLAIIALLALNLFMPVQSVRSAQQYQYKVVEVTYTNVDEVNIKLNSSGQEGWEFVQIVIPGGFAVFKK
ncbi:MAG: DUF4177 domain-containing protein [Syntrophobacteraceae bacterium]|jgi:hypothetical protein